MNRILKCKLLLNINQRFLLCSDLSSLKYEKNQLGINLINKPYSSSQSEKSKALIESKKESKAKSIRAFVGVACIWAMFIYFGFMREENDIDKFLISLEKPSATIRIMTLQKQIENHQRLGLETKFLKAELREEIEKASGTK